MRGLVQRVSSASVTVRTTDGPDEEVGRIGAGLCVLVGVTHHDDDRAARQLAEKVWNLNSDQWMKTREASMKEWRETFGVK